ncbi:MAG: GreA/GreB family elongation factor [Parachlamydiaceae bacterium]|nr:GreA/GreB family elongation factor [Parachlamydiaceae bacterium]
MGYLEEFQTQINRRDFPKFLQLWEEYCTNDTVDVEEFSQLLEAIKSSEIIKLFGQIVETAVPVWKMISDQGDSYKIMKQLIDLQLTNSPNLYNIAFELLKKKYKNDPQFEERIRLAGIRTPENFQGALANYDLLAHMGKGKFVFHSGGWGTGEITDLSFLREQISIEFENVPGLKHLSLNNAFKVLIPLADEHFLARRFGDADKLEKEAKDQPLAIVKMLLQDLGPKTSGEIKDILCDFVIPEDDWAKWWQTTRAKLKKDTLIESPKTVREQFRLRKNEVRHEDRFLKAINEKKDPIDVISTAYNFTRDFPVVLKDEKIKKMLVEKFLLLSEENLSDAEKFQVHIFLEDFLGYQFPGNTLEVLIQKDYDFEAIVEATEILALKKRMLVLIRSHRKDWFKIFSDMFFSSRQSGLREYLCKELNQEEPELFTKELQSLLKAPLKNPDLFVWYFQLLLGKDQEKLPFGSHEGLFKWFEGLLILLHGIEFKPEFRELTKKIYTLFSGKRYALVRKMLEGSSLPFAKEFLLLTSKCQIFTESEQKILRSLAAVVHPTLSKEQAHQRHPHSDSQIIWTTEEGYQTMQERVRQLGTTEIVANAREIEAARAHGDLRENSEYKFSLEKRSRLQSELKNLSEQLGRARIITRADVTTDEVTVGSIVDLVDSKGTQLHYTILGPWDADPEKNILSLQSKLVQAILGSKKDDVVNFRGEDYKIVSLKTIFD